MEKILIHFDEKLFEKYLKESERVLIHVDNLIQCYNELQIGEFKQEVFDKLLKQGTGFVEIAFEKDLEKQLKAFKNQEVRNNIIKGADIPLIKFKENYDLTFKNYSSPRFPLNLVIIVDNKATLTEETLEELKATKCSIYVSTEEEKEVYAAIMAMKEVYEKTLVPVLSKYNYLSKFDGFESVEDFFDYSSKHELKLNPYCIETILTFDKNHKEQLKEIAEQEEIAKRRQSQMSQGVHIHSGDNPTPFFVTNKEKERYFSEDFQEHKKSGLI